MNFALLSRPSTETSFDDDSEGGGGWEWGDLRPDLDEVREHAQPYKVIGTTVVKTDESKYYQVLRDVDELNGEHFDYGEWRE